MDHAKSNAAYALHRCITADQKAHYDKKIKAEKEMWGYDKMTDADKKTFDDYITKWTAFHQENDAKVKEEVGYYTMTNDEKKIYDKLSVQMREKEDYYDEKFDATVKKAMQQTKFLAMTDDQKKEYLNKMRDTAFNNMRKVVQTGDADMIAKKAMDYFGISADKRGMVEHVIRKWNDTRGKVEDGIKGQMTKILREKAEDFEKMTND